MGYHEYYDPVIIAMNKSDAYLLGIDLGTTATKAALYRIDGSMVGEGRADVTISHPEPHRVEQDMSEFYESAALATRKCMASCNADPRAIIALAFDSQMAGIGALDEDFRPVDKFDSWLDMRCEPFIEQLNLKHRRRITELTGCPPMCAHGPKMLWWQHERPADYARISKFVMPVCYVAGRMAGLRIEEAFIDNTFIHFSGCSDALQGKWSKELCELLGIDQRRLPRVVDPTRIVGEVSASAARDFGLCAGTVIAAGCGDTAAGALGAGAVYPGMLLDTAGTASVLSVCTDRFFSDTTHFALLVSRSVVSHVWTALAYVGGGGLALPWFRENLLANTPADESHGLERLLAQCESIPPGCDGLIFSPHLGGRTCPPAPAMRGAWIGFTWKHTQAHFTRSIAESVAYEYAWYLSIIRKLLPTVNFGDARVIGGGAKSTVWNGIKANILGVPFRRLQRSESATWGSALIAAKAIGLIDDIAEAACETASVCTDVIHPDPTSSSVYLAGFRRYIFWQDKLTTSFENGSRCNSVSTDAG